MTDNSQPGRSRLHNYHRLGRELSRRTLEPLGYPTFIIFFVVAVLGFGGLGFWWELYVYGSSTNAHTSVDPLRTALMTLLPALVGPATLQAILAEDKRELRALAFFAFVALFPTALSVGPSSSVSNSTSFVIGILAWIAASWMWWITNADQLDLRERINPKEALGGDDPKADLSGNLDGFTH